ncbi:hypothetical protein HZH66_000668 [Vespula vulgaris]|uniref:Uncharacterized protein n=1 Tax=Vespula vulgaris TaxID=7454 RepID=A0A834KRW5_VESVU|nr:hypothetical protein HZH66_000668 [Vespula vulgaris]
MDRSAGSTAWSSDENKEEEEEEEDDGEKLRLKLDLSRCFWDGQRFTVEKEGEAKDDEEEKGPFVTLQLLFRGVAAAVTAVAAAVAVCCLQNADADVEEEGEEEEEEEVEEEEEEEEEEVEEEEEEGNVGRGIKNRVEKMTGLSLP